MTFTVGGVTHAAAPGTTVFVPRGAVHTFSNVGTAPARMLFMYSPAGMEGMFAEIGAPGARGVQGPPRSAADVEALIAVAAKYGFTIGG